MLSIVPQTINNSRRLVVLNHPNSMECEVWRKQIKRTELTAAAPNDVLGGMPTIGGLGVLNAEDESDVDWIHIGDAKVLFGGIFQGASEMDADNALIPVQQSEAQIECILQPGDVGHFTVDRNDLIMAMPGGGIVLPFEVVGETGSINIPPYAIKYLLNARDDLAYIPGISESMNNRDQI